MNRITGTDKSETLNGTGGDDYIQGASGDDVLNGGSGDDTLIDSYDRNSDGAYADSEPDADKLYGGAGNDILIHYQGVLSNDAVQDQDGDLLDGGDGDDTFLFFGGQKGCAAIGGAGIDTLQFGLHGTLPNGAEISTPMDMELIGSSVSVILNIIDPVYGRKPAIQVSGSGIERVQFASGAGDDKLVGGSREDTLESYGGRDEIHGNGGNDYITIDLTDYAGAAPTNVLIDGGAGIDTFDFSSSIDSTENFVLDLNAGTYTADGRSLGPITGFESLSVWTRDGDDHLTGGALADHLRADNGSNTLIGNGGNDILTAGDGVDTLDGGTGNDFLSAGFGNDSLTGGAGNDQLDGGSGFDLMDGGAGDDTYVVDYYYDYRDDPATAPRDVIHDASGIDRIVTTMSTFDMRFYADVENLLLSQQLSSNVTGNARDNVIVEDPLGDLTADGGGGNDTITGGNYSNTLSGGTGNDTLTGGAYTDALDGGAGNDTLHGKDGDDTAHGGAGNDVIYGDSRSSDPNVVFGSGKLTKHTGQGVHDHPLSLDDQFSLAANPDIENATTLPHVSVTSTLQFDFNDYFRGDHYTISLKAGGGLVLDVDTGSTSGLDASAIILDATGNQLAESSYGSGREKSTGSPNGNDPFLTFVAPTTGVYTIWIKPDSSFAAGSKYRLHVSLGDLGGADTLSGDAGNDTLYGGEAQDVLDGGVGNDRLDGGTGGDTMTGGKGNDVYFVDDASDTVVESAGAGSGSDTVRSAVTIKLLADNVETLVLTGSSGLSGTGNGLANTIVGNSGANTLDGGFGRDILTGGAGKDSFLFRTAPSAANLDHIKDFTVVDDTIRLENAVFKALTQPGLLHENAFASIASGSTIVGGSARILYDKGHGTLYYDSDGGNASGRVAFAILDTHPALTHADVLVV